MFAMLFLSALLLRIWSSFNGKSLLLRQLVAHLFVLSDRTIWYEMLCGEWPFKKQPPESIIWQVGKGMKQSLTHVQASREVKVKSRLWFISVRESIPRRLESPEFQIRGSENA
jgi:hypothetical protein